MNLKRWSTVILMMGLFLALSPLGAQAEPYPPFEPHPNYHHPRGNAYGWQGPRTHAYARNHKYYRGTCMGPHYPRRCGHQVYEGPPLVTYVRPVTPIIGIQPFQQPQPVFSPPASPGFHGQITF